MAVVGVVVAAVVVVGVEVVHDLVVARFAVVFDLVKCVG